MSERPPITSKTNIIAILEEGLKCKNVSKVDNLCKYSSRDTSGTMARTSGRQRDVMTLGRIKVAIHIRQLLAESSFSQQLFLPY